MIIMMINCLDDIEKLADTLEFCIESEWHADLRGRCKQNPKRLRSTMGIPNGYDLVIFYYRMKVLKEWNLMRRHQFLLSR